MSTALSTGAGPLSLMSCVRESSPPQDNPHFEGEKSVGAAKRKFWNPRKWFKRKVAKTGDECVAATEAAGDGGLRSRSASELSVDEDRGRRSGTPMHPGLSVSHDSVFHSPHSGSEVDLDNGQSTSLSNIHPVPDFRLQTELVERLRLRRVRGDTSEDDEGLPRSPCNSPTANEGLLDKPHHHHHAKEHHHTTKSHSTCSDGSLLSMGSSDMDDDSLGQQSSRHSSKLSLHDKKPQESPSAVDSAWEFGAATNPLNHSAAHHKSAVRPKRTHGAPRRRKVQQITPTALPTTPEVNEEFPRSLTPEELRGTCRSAETQLKCSSLPPGLAGPAAFGKLNSSSSRSEEHFGALTEEDEEKSEKSFFERLFPRRSAKKRVKAPTPRKPTGAAARQRVQPVDIPPSPEPKRSPMRSPEKSPSASPLHVELETRFRQVVSREEPKSRVKIAGLSALQQRVLLHNDDVDDGGFKSLTDLPTDVVRVKPVAKSHSFKVAKPATQEVSRFTYAAEEERRMSIVKAASLDSVKNSEDVVETVPEQKVAVKPLVEVKPLVDTKPQLISVTKIQMKEEAPRCVPQVPEFLHRQLNKVETRPSSNVILKTSTSPKIIEEETKPKVVVEQKVEQEPKEALRKFSKEDVEIVDKDTEEEVVEVPKQPLVVTQRIYKKHENNQRKSSIDKPMLKTKSLEIVGSIKKENSLDGLDKLADAPENVVVLRRKSLPKPKTDDEPELMKVFARRSLKLKDGESEEVSQMVRSATEDALQNKSRDSDKENVQDSPSEERRKSVGKLKEPLMETTEVTLRKPTNNKFSYQRTVSVTTPKVEVSSDVKVRKQASFNDRPKTDNWFLNRKQDAEAEENVAKPRSELIEDFAVKSKNFNQKKAEWEKRAQEAMKKKVP